MFANRSLKLAKDLIIRPFPQGPSVHFKAYFKKGVLQKTTLDLSSQGFLYTSFGDGPDLLPWIHSYLSGKHLPFKPPLSFSPFQSKALQAISSISFGEKFSYKQIGEQIGYPLSARAVGNACNLNPFPLLIPCHRVIKSDGSNGGFAFDLKIKDYLLSFEHQFIGMNQISC